ncbi:cyclic nucleotide-binding domain-containing protein [Umezawaea sp.]|uniref:Crp/Fnr family transcriptional regulator n=1 Tax=Umezawaea sp. TaxID=1955258 RepID=UPI002ED1E1EC
MTSAPMTELDGLPLLAGLSHDQRAALAGIARHEDYEPGARLFEEGRLADRCWVVTAGCAVVDTDIPGRGRTVVQSVGPGELLGWSWLVPPYRWHFGASIAAPTSAVVVDALDLRRLADADPVLGYRMSRILVEALLNRLQATRIRLLDLYRHPDGD